MTRHLILDNSAMVIDRDNHRVFSDPTCSIKDKSKPYKHRPLSCAEFKELQWQHAKTHHFPGFLIVCFKEDCVWLSDETTMLREKVSKLWKSIQVKLQENKRTALMMAFHPRLGEQSLLLLGSLEPDLVKQML